MIFRSISFFSYLNHNLLPPPIRKTIQYLPSVIFPAIFNLLLIATAGRYISAGELGIYYLKLSIVNLGAIIFGNWMQQSIVRFESGGVDILEEKRSFHLLFLLFSSIVILSISISVKGLSNVMSSLDLIDSFIVALIVVEIWYKNFMSVLQSENNANEYSIFTSIFYGLRYFIAWFLFWYYGLLSHVSLLIGWLVAEIIVVMIIFFRLSYHQHIHLLRAFIFQLKRHKSKFLKYSSYGLPMLGFMLISEARPFADRVIIMFFQQEAQVGVHGSNYTLGINAISLISLPLLLSFHTHLMSIANSVPFDSDFFKMNLRNAMKIYLILTTIVSVTIIPNSMFFSEFIFGKELGSGFYVIPLTMLGSLITGLSIYAGKGLEATQRTVTMLIANCIIFIVAVSTTVIFVYYFGYIGAAYGYIAAGVVSVPLFTYLTSRKYRTAIPGFAFSFMIIMFLLSYIVAGLDIGAELKFIGSMLLVLASIVYLFKNIETLNSTLKTSISLME